MSRQTVAYWLKSRAGIVPQTTGRMSHKDLLPWAIRKEHIWDGIARGLRAVSKQRQGGQLTNKEAGQAAALEEHCDTYGVVVAYERSGRWAGFTFVPRDPAIDQPEDIIRRP